MTNAFASMPDCIACVPDPLEKKGVWSTVTSDYSLGTFVSKGFGTQAASRNAHNCSFLQALRIRPKHSRCIMGKDRHGVS